MGKKCVVFLLFSSQFLRFILSKRTLWSKVYIKKAGLVERFLSFALSDTFVD